MGINCIDEQRAAQLCVGTVASRAQVDDAAATVTRLKISLHQQQNEFAAARAIARVLSAE